MKRRLVVLLATLSLLVMAAVPTDAAFAWGNCVRFYTVRPGDTLASIARQFGTSWPYLASINGIFNPNRIFWGMTLCVQIYTPPPQNVTYVVQRGDWLALIARRFNVSIFALLQANPLMNPNLIYPGQVLVIPTYNGYSQNLQPYSAPSNGQMNAPYTPPVMGGGSINVPPPNATPEASG
jgi:LysM repeat protein